MRMLARVELKDEVGSLARVGGALAAIGVNVVGLDVHALTGGAVADQLVLDLPEGGDADQVAAALEASAAHVCELRPVDPHEVVDPVVRALDLTRLVRDRPAEAVATLLGADCWWAGPVPGFPLVGAAARAVADQVPVQAREPVKRLLPVDGEPAWVLAVPARLPGGGEVVVVARRAPRFSFTETARAQALLRAAEPTPGRSEVVALADGGSVDVRALDARDQPALLRLHARCSGDTRYRRYFTGMGALPPSLADRLLDGDQRHRVVLGAALGSELVGVAHCHRLGDGTAEVAVLVEDAHQRRGIGSELLRRVVRPALEDGIHRLVAITLPGNDPMRRTFGRLGPVEGRFEDGNVVLSVEVARTPAVNPR